MSTTSLSGFGDHDDPSSVAYFHIEADSGSGVYPDWDQDVISTTRHIPGSSRNDTFISGFGLATITLSVWFDDRASFAKLRAKYTATDTLRLLAVFTSQDGTVKHILDGHYEDFANATLIRIGRVLHQVDGTVETELTFQRGWDPVTGLGVV